MGDFPLTATFDYPRVTSSGSAAIAEKRVPLSPKILNKHMGIAENRRDRSNSMEEIRKVMRSLHISTPKMQSPGI